MFSSIDKYCSLKFNFFQNILKENVISPKPDKMTLGQLKLELEIRGLSTTGSKEELIWRLTQDDLSKKIACVLNTLFVLVFSCT